MNEKGKYNLNEYIGKKYGHLTILDIDKENKNLLICKCECDRIVKRSIYSILVSKNPICGYCYNGKSYNTLIGFRSGLLTIQNINSKKCNNDNYVKRKFAYCKCDCGTYKDFPLKNIMQGNTKKCGECLNGKKYIDYIGEKYGTFTINEVYNNTKVQRYFAKCKCEVCDIVIDLELAKLVREKIACKNCKSKKQNEKIDKYIGKKIGNITILNITKETIYRNRVQYKTAICKCICGRMIERKFQSTKLPSGQTCGKCFQGIKYEDYIGKEYGYLKIKKVFNSRKIICKCKCNNEIETSLLNLKRIRKSYGCGKCYKGIPFNSYIGKTFGSVTLIELIEPKIKSNNSLSGLTIKQGKCKCICGEEFVISLHRLFNCNTKTCGNCYRGIKYEDYVGKTFGYLTIQEVITGSNKTKKTHQLKKEGTYIKYSCKCNKNKYLYTQLSNLFIKRPYLSCGCLNGKIKTLRQIKFGKLQINRTSCNNENGLRYICKCDCGNEIEVLESELFTGKVTCCEECQSFI